MKIFLVAAVVSLLSTLLLIRSFRSHRWEQRLTKGTKPQRIHSRPVSRLGGVGIYIGLVCTVPVAWQQLGSEAGRIWALLLVCSLPAFATGVVQDLTDKLSPRQRLAATLVAAGMAYYLLDNGIRDTDIPGLDWLVAFGAGSLALTLLTVTGIANAINIIDGLNGLASMCVAIMTVAVAYVSLQVDDLVVFSFALALLGAALGFFIWNYPAGLIFLGDGGSYLLGFVLAQVSLLLLARHPGEVSPLFPLLSCFYPVFETLFSIYRRRVLRALPPSVPDGIHLHSLIYRRVVRWAVGAQTAKALTRRNSMSAPYLWVLCGCSAVPSVLFWDNSAALAACLSLFASVYLALYWRIVRFRAPRLLRKLASRPVPLDAGDNPRT